MSTKEPEYRKTLLGMGLYMLTAAIIDTLFERREYEFFIAGWLFARVMILIFYE